jgi:hypothetical protein
VAQGIGPEFKPQYCKQTNKQKTSKNNSALTVLTCALTICKLLPQSLRGRWVSAISFNTAINKTERQTLRVS